MICAWLHAPLLQNHTQANLLPTSLGQFLTATQETISQDIILRKSPNKLKFTALTLYVVISVDYWEENFPWGKVNEAARLQQKRFCKNSQFRDGSKLYVKPDLQFRALQNYKRVSLLSPLLSQDCRFRSDSCSVLEGGDSSWLQVEGPGLSATREARL